MAESASKTLIEPVRKKRKRTIITPEQVDKLESLYLREQWPSRLRKEDLAQELGQTEHFVSVWFQNRRARQKKEELLTKESGKSHNIQMTRVHSAPHLQRMNEDQFNSDIKLQVSDDLNHNRVLIPHPTVSKPMNICNLVTKTISLPSGFSKNQGTRSLPKTIALAPNSLSKASTSSCNQPSQSNSRTKLMKILVKPRPGFEEEQKLLAKKNMLSNDQTNDEPAPQISLPKSNIKDKPASADFDYSATLFKTIINMICVAEGGIMDRNHPDYDQAVNDYLYGIRINGDTRLVYSKETGLELIPFQTE